MVLNVSELHPKNSSKTSCDAPSWRRAWLKIRSKRLSWGDKTGEVFTGEKRGLQRCLTGFVSINSIKPVIFGSGSTVDMFLLHVLLVLLLCDDAIWPHFLQPNADLQCQKYEDLMLCLGVLVWWWTFHAWGLQKSRWLQRWFRWGRRISPIRVGMFLFDACVDGV